MRAHQLQCPRGKWMKQSTRKEAAGGQRTASTCCFFLAADTVLRVPHLVMLSREAGKLISCQFYNFWKHHSPNETGYDQPRNYRLQSGSRCFASIPPPKNQRQTQSQHKSSAAWCFCSTTRHLFTQAAKSRVWDAALVSRGEGETQAPIQGFLTYVSECLSEKPKLHIELVEV